MILGENVPSETEAQYLICMMKNQKLHQNKIVIIEFQGFLKMFQ